MQSAPNPGGVRLPTLVLVGVVLLSILVGCVLGVFLGGAGGFMFGQQQEAGQREGLQRQVADLQSQLQAAQSRPTATVAAGGQAQPKTTSPTSAPSQPGAQATAPAGQPGVASPTRPPSGAQPQATAPAAGPAPSVYLGVRYNNLNADIAAQVGITITQGALIGEVLPDSPADKAGLAPEDVITAMDGRELTDSYNLGNAVTSKKPGDRVTFKVFRDGRFMTVEAILAAPPSGVFNTPVPGVTPTPRLPGPTQTPRSLVIISPTPGAPRTTPTAGAPAATARPPSGATGPTVAPTQATTRQTPSATQPGAPRAYLGVQVSPVTEEVAKARGLKSASGALIEQVMPASPAFQAGLFDGDIILAVEGTAVDQKNSLTSLVATRKPGDKVKLRVVRNGKEEDLTITLGSTTREFNEARP